MYHLKYVDELLAGIAARQVAVRPVFTLSAATSCAEAWDTMQPSARDISVVLVSGGPELTYAERDDAWRGASASLGTVAVPVPTSYILEPSATLKDVVDVLVKHPFCLLRGEPISIVAAADLGRPAFSVWAFATLLSFEDALTRLFPSVSHGLWRNALSDEQREALRGKVEKRRRDDMFLEEEACLSLGEKVRIGSEYVAPLLGLSKTAWRNQFGGFVAIRNDIAHGRPIGSTYTKGPQKALEQLVNLRSSIEKLWALVDDRAHVWDAYITTVVQFDASLPPGDFWMISAQNPMEERLPQPENDARHDALCELLKRHNAFAGEGYGKSGKEEPGAWRERMALMYPGSDGLACEIAEKFGQRSVFKFSGDWLIVLETATRAERARREFAGRA